MFSHKVVSTWNTLSNHVVMSPSLNALFSDGTVITGKFCVGVPLNNQSIYLYSLNAFKSRLNTEYIILTIIADY